MASEAICQEDLSESGHVVAPIEISRRIEAPAATVFRILADPTMHTELDGSGMLRGAVTGDPLTAVSDVFVMKMYFSELGDYQMNNHVVEFEQDRRIGWEPVDGSGHPNEGTRMGHRWTFVLDPQGPDATTVTEMFDCSRSPEEFRLGMDNGDIWGNSMRATLERLDEAVSLRSHESG
jgi:uncharacterized protein YndB with AHSA1/START domain